MWAMHQASLCLPVDHTVSGSRPSVRLPFVSMMELKVFTFFCLDGPKCPTPGAKHRCKCCRGERGPRRVVCLRCVWTHVRQVEVFLDAWREAECSRHVGHKKTEGAGMPHDN